MAIEKPSIPKDVVGGIWTAVKWLAFAAVVAGTIAAFAPASAIGVALLGEGATAVGFAAFKAGAAGLFTAGGTAGIVASVIGGLSFLKGAFSTHKAQEKQITDRELAKAEAAAHSRGPSQTVEKGSAKGITFEASAGPSEKDPNKKSVSFTTQVEGRREQTASRSPG